MTSGPVNTRKATLDAYIARRAAQGFRVETRSALQAVIVRPHRLHFLLRRFAHASGEQRFVVSVDQHGVVHALPAQPLRC